MPRPPLARERVLDAFEALLIDDGERAATLDATARAAGVSKGGLLYHFASKDELATGLLARLRTLADEDLANMAGAPDGAVAYFIRTSVMDDSAFDRALVAASKLAQGGHSPAGEALRRIREEWADALRPYVKDETALDLVLLVSDGLYYNNVLDASGHEAAALAGPAPSGDALSRLIALVTSATT
ncbi:TetR/AcrR family transcriptional regulator [Microbacterium sp. NPDC055903]